MIKLKEEKKSTLEQEIYEAQVEEALAKWESAKIPVLKNDNNKTDAHGGDAR